MHSSQTPGYERVTRQSFWSCQAAVAGSSAGVSRTARERNQLRPQLVERHGHEGLDAVGRGAHEGNRGREPPTSNAATHVRPRQSGPTGCRLAGGPSGGKPAGRKSNFGTNRTQPERASWLRGCGRWAVLECRRVEAWCGRTSPLLVVGIPTWWGEASIWARRQPQASSISSRSRLSA